MGVKMAKDEPPKHPPSAGGKKPGDKGPDGTDAWQRLTAQTRPLSAAQRDKGHDIEGDKKSAKSSAGMAKYPRKAARSSDSTAPRNLSSTPAKASKDKPPPRPEIEQKNRRRLGRGRIELQGSLDLHGMTLAEAEAALKGFVSYHRAQGHRWVLVITGKGVRGEGRLRKALPEWLETAPLSQAVAEFDHAAVSHGGGGAYYLRLRRIAPSKPAPNPR